MSKRIAHIVNAADLEANFKSGKKTKTFCGLKKVAIHAPKDWPVCQRCVEVSRARRTYTFTISTSSTAGSTTWKWYAA